MNIKSVLFLLNLVISEVKAQTQSELRSKVLNALRARSETAELKVTQSDSKAESIYKLSLHDLDPQTLKISEITTAKILDEQDLMKLGINADVLSYSYFNSGLAKSFGFSKKFHITYTSVLSSTASLTHYLVYYDKSFFYPVKVTYFNGEKKIMSVEYQNYKKIKDKVWRAQLITAENHISQKQTRIEISKIEINSTKPQLKMGQNPVEKSY